MAEKPKAPAGHEHDWEMRWSLLVADAWADEHLKKRLMSDPAGVLKERGLAVPPGAQIKVLEDTPTAMHLVIPMKPSEAELSEEELTSVAGGQCGPCRCGCGCGPCRCGCGCGPCGCGPCGGFCRCGGGGCGPCRCFGS